VRRLFITANGRDLYRAEWARYREFYPDVEAPELSPVGLAIVNVDDVAHLSSTPPVEHHGWLADGGEP
jgi:hypothetical protein